jgi:sugar lactone lactonase YvrE
MPMLGDLDVVVHHRRVRLSEGPVWDVQNERLLWVDILVGAVHSLAPDTGNEHTWKLDCHVGAVAPRADGGLVVADQRGFSLLDEQAGSRARPVAEILEPGLRMNDGACDPLGNFWAGSMSYDQAPGAGSLFRLDSAAQVSTVLHATTVANGLGWSPNATTMYFVDSGTGRVDAFDWAATGELTGRRRVVEIPRSTGVPDGLTVDADGALWIAIWGGGCVRRYNPAGELLQTIELPVSQVTSCAFGGRALDELYITTGAYDLSVVERREQPLAGAVFRSRPGVRGLPATPYRG